MFERISNGWALAKQGFQVLRMDKKLLVFPVLSGIACLAVLVSFALPLWFTGFAEQLAKDENRQANPLGYVVLFAFYFANYFVIVFFNSALVACAVIRLKGLEPTLQDGLGAAIERLPQILGWALVAASVGVILRAIESRSEKVGAIVASVLGMSWTIVTYFVVPTIVIEKAGPLKAIQRSTAILRSTWGESLAARFGIGGIAFLFNIPAIVLMMAGVFILAAGNVAIGMIVLAVGVLALLFISLVSTAVNTIVLAALYLYAATNQLPGAFDAAQLRGAFAAR